jgi:nucleotide-binding universal stress UspA family protein
MALETRPSVRDRSITRMLIAVHGYESSDWAQEAAGAVQRPGRDIVRIVPVLDLPQAPFTSLLPAAKRRYGGAVAAWRHAEHARLQGTVRALTAALAAALISPAEVVYLEARRADPGRTAADHAVTWGADLVVVGRDTRSRAWRALFGAVHERVLRYAPCAVLVAGLDDVTAPAASSVEHPGRLQARA